SRLMPRRLKSQAPPTAKKSSTPPATSTARRARRRCSSGGRPPPRARNTGTSPTGSMTTSRVRKDLRASAAKGSSSPSGDEQDLAAGPAPLEGPMGVGGFRQGEAGPDAQPQLARGDPAQHLRGAHPQAVAVGHVVEQRRPRQEERSLRRQQAGIEGRHRPARLAEEDQHAPLGQAAQ